MSVSSLNDPAQAARVLSAGAGRIETTFASGQTRVVRLASHAPLKLLVPRHAGPAVSVYASTYGGGLLAGDRIELSVDCGAGTTLFLRSQSATKVYRSETNASSGQSLHAVVRDGATLVSMPDPVTCFANARYVQNQSVDLCAGASVLLLDWLTSGRAARGEMWQVDQFESRIDVREDSAPIFRDATVLDSADQPIRSTFAGGRFGCFATVVLIGPMFADDAVTLQADIGTMRTRRQADLIVSTSPVARKGLLVRLAATTTQHATDWLSSRLQFLSRLTGSDPFGRKW